MYKFLSSRDLFEIVIDLLGMKGWIWLGLGNIVCKIGGCIAQVGEEEEEEEDRFLHAFWLEIRFGPSPAASILLGNQYILDIGRQSRKTRIATVL